MTFWQITPDLPFSTGIPGGQGHNHTTEQVDGWYAVMRPTGLTTADLDSLKEIIAKLE